MFKQLHGKAKQRAMLLANGYPMFYAGANRHFVIVVKIVNDYFAVSGEFKLVRDAKAWCERKTKRTPSKYPVKLAKAA